MCSEPRYLRSAFNEIDGVEVSLHEVCLGLAEAAHGEVHPVWEVAECAVPLSTPLVLPLAVNVGPAGSPVILV